MKERLLVKYMIDSDTLKYVISKGMEFYYF